MSDISRSITLRGEHFDVELDRRPDGTPVVVIDDVGGEYPAHLCRELGELLLAAAAELEQMAQ